MRYGIRHKCIVERSQKDLDSGDVKLEGIILEKEKKNIEDFFFEEYKIFWIAQWLNL